MRGPEWSLRSFIAAIMVLTVVAVVFIVGVSVVLGRIPLIERESERQIQMHSDEYAASVKLMLGSLDSRIETLARAYPLVDRDGFAALLERTAAGTPGIEALYLAGKDGRIVATGLSASGKRLREDILGSDVSGTVLFRKVVDTGSPQWSDAYLSALTGGVTVGFAAPAGEDHVLLGEVPLAAVLDAVKLLVRANAPPLWIVDSRGEVIVDTGPQTGTATSPLSVPPDAWATSGVEKLRVGGRSYHVGLAKSDALGWRFITTLPAGLANPRLQTTIMIVAAAFGIAVLVSLVLAPVWARQIAAPLGRIVDQARRTARGGPSKWPRGRILELNALSADLESMAQSLREREQRFSAIFNASPSPLLVSAADEGFRCVYVNDAWLALFGWQRQEILGRTGRQVDLWESPEERDALFARAALGPVRSEMRMHRNDGTGVLCILSSSAFRIDGEQLIIWAHEDITELRRMEDELRSLNVELESRVAQRTEALARSNRSLSQALSNLERAQRELVRAEKMAALGSLVAGVAHELNTPIGNGLMAVTTLRDHAREFDEARQSGLRRSDLNRLLRSVAQATDIATRNLRRAADLVASFKQVAVDQTSSQRRRFDLAEVVDEIAVTLQPTIKRTPFTLRNEVARGFVLDSYPGPLGQALTNLINNALIHAFEGRASGQVRITARALDDDTIEILVCDDGRGIPAELVGRIFEPFVTSRLGSGGSGLGLHITWNAVTNVLGGRVDVKTEAGKGSCFEMRIPAVAPQAQPAANHRST